MDQRCDFIDVTENYIDNSFLETEFTIDGQKWNGEQRRMMVTANDGWHC